MDGLDIAAGIVANADRLEREMDGRALTDDQAKTIRAANFLRKIAPYLNDDAVARVADDPLVPTPRA